MKEGKLHSVSNYQRHKCSQLIGYCHGEEGWISEESLMEIVALFIRSFPTHKQQGGGNFVKYVGAKLSGYLMPQVRLSLAVICA